MATKKPAKKTKHLHSGKKLEAQKPLSKPDMHDIPILKNIDKSSA